MISFTAVWCPSCIVMKNRLEKIKTELPWFEWLDYNFDIDKTMLEKYAIGRDIPVFVFFDQAGNEFHRMQGEIDRKDFIKFLEENKNK